MEYVFAIVNWGVCEKVFFFTLFNLASFIREHTKEEIRFYSSKWELLFGYSQGKIKNVLLADSEVFELENLIREEAYHKIEYIKKISMEDFRYEKGPLFLLEQKEAGVLDCNYYGKTVLVSHEFYKRFGHIRQELMFAILELLKDAYEADSSGSGHQELLFHDTRICTDHKSFSNGEYLLVISIKGE